MYIDFDTPPLEKRIRNLELKTSLKPSEPTLRKVGEVLGNVIYIKVSSNHSQDEADDIAYEVRQALNRLHKYQIDKKLKNINKSE